MKAIVYTRYGAPEVLSLQDDLDKPTPKDNELLIRVRAAEATKADCELRSFNFAVKWFWLPLRLALGLRRPRRSVLGGYFAGEVEAVGSGVSQFKPGDQLFGSCGMRLGAYGDYVCLPESYTLAHKPHNMSYAESAAVPLGGLNALHFMRLANLQPGEHVLINGAGGSIGLFALQIAKSMGAQVTAVDSGAKLEMLHKLGADHCIDYAQQDFTQGAHKGEGKYDVVFNMVAGSDLSQNIQVLKPGGRYLMGNPKLSDMLRTRLINRKGEISASYAFAKETKEELQALRQMIEQDKLVAVIDQIYPRSQAADAHRKVETEQRIGIVVLSHDANSQT